MCTFSAHFAVRKRQSRIDACTIHYSTVRSSTQIQQRRQRRPQPHHHTRTLKHIAAVAGLCLIDNHGELFLLLPASAQQLLHLC